MKARELMKCCPDVLTPDDSIAAAAELMHYGDDAFVPVVSDPANLVLVGVITARDIVVRCVAEGRDPDATLVGSVMTVPPVCAPESTPIETALSRMASARIRRLVVVDAEGRLVGILALDDVLELLAEEEATIGRLLARRGGGC